MSNDEYLITDAPLKALTVFAMPMILGGFFQRNFIVFLQCLFDTAQAGGGAAAPGIAGGGVVVVQLALCPAAGEVALIEG